MVEFAVLDAIPILPSLRPDLPFTVQTLTELTCKIAKGLCKMQHRGVLRAPNPGILSGDRKSFFRELKAKAYVDWDSMHLLQVIKAKSRNTDRTASHFMLLSLLLDKGLCQASLP